MIILLLTAFAAFADHVCDSHELVPGNAGRYGTVTMGAPAFSLKWDGDEHGLASEGVLCGEKLPATAKCQVRHHASGPTASARMTCIDTAKDPFDNKIGDGHFVYSEVSGVGRFSCAHGTKQKLIEFNNCR